MGPCYNPHLLPPHVSQTRGPFKIRDKVRNVGSIVGAVSKPAPSLEKGRTARALGDGLEPEVVLSAGEHSCSC